MKIMRAIAAGMLAAAFSSPPAAYGMPDILERAEEHATSVSYAFPQIFENPAMTPMRYASSLGTANVRFYRDLQREYVNPQEGRGEGYGAIEAGAYIKNGYATLTGHAGYRTGTLFDIQWNESGDYSRIFPYVIADAVGGNLHQERYSFDGGYSHRKKNLSWGVEGGYTAGLFYRKSDPRPKTITGDLRLKAGVAYDAFRGYMVGVSGTFFKYRQQTDIKFISELGESKLYHLTGPGTQYARFAGAGSNVYNDSYSYEVSLDIYPSRQSGPVLSAKFSRMTMGHVITDLNRLPMASLRENSLAVEGGWIHREESGFLTATARWDHHRRIGREGIFGDAVSGSYPLIGELELFTDIAWNLNLKAQWVHFFKNFRIGTSIYGGYSHHRQDYLWPHIYELVNCGETAGQAFAIYRAGKRLLIRLDGAVSRRWNVGSRLSTGNAPDDAELRSLHDCVATAFTGAISGLTSAGVGLHTCFMLTNNYALGLALDWTHRHYDKGNRQNIFSSSLNFIF